MKKLATIISIVISCGIIIALLFYRGFEILDEAFIEPLIAVEINNLNYQFVDDEYCSTTDSHWKSKYSCKLFSLETIDRSSIIDTLGKELIITDEFSDKDGTDTPKDYGIVVWIFSLISSDLSEAYLLKYSDKYQAKWEYSMLNIFVNYNMFSARLGTLLDTVKLDDEDNLIHKGDVIIIVNEINNSLIIRRIHDDTEMIYVFSKDKH